MGGTRCLEYRRRLMPVQPCPACSKPTPRRLDHTSEYAHVNYYRCEGCSHIWTTSKKDGSLVTHVTPLAPEPKGPKKK